MILTKYNEYIYNDAVAERSIYENEFRQVSNQNQLAGYHYSSFTLQIYNCLICNVYSSRTIENASSDQENKKSSYSLCS